MNKNRVHTLELKIMARTNFTVSRHTPSRHGGSGAGGTSSVRAYLGEPLAGAGLRAEEEGDPLAAVVGVGLLVLLRHGHDWPRGRRDWPRGRGFAVDISPEP